MPTIDKTIVIDVTEFKNVLNKINQTRTGTVLIIINKDLNIVLLYMILGLFHS
ncbi:hypothetical protein NWP96_05365 [Mycoplasmopsis cynos]|nr:hypothetical protein [Mycoplasmopsis cynos]